MKRILLDTSAYSAASRGHSDVKHVLQFADHVVVNPVVLGELVSGFLGGSRVEENREVLRRFLASDRVQVVTTDDHFERLPQIAVDFHPVQPPPPRTT